MTTMSNIPEYVMNYLDACSGMVSNQEFADYSLEQAEADLDTIHNELYAPHNEFDEDEQESRWNDEFGSLTAEEYLDYVHAYGEFYLNQEK